MSGTEPPFTPPSKTERSEGQPMTEQQKVQEQWPPRSRIMANTPQNLSLLFPRHSPEQSILNVIISECGYRTTRPTKKPNSLFFPLPYTPAYLPGVFILFFSYLFALFIYPPFFGFFYFHSRVYFGKWHRAELGKVLGTSPEEPRKRVQPDIYKEKKRNTVYLLRPVPYTAVALTIPSPSRPSYFVHGAWFLYLFFSSFQLSSFLPVKKREENETDLLGRKGTTGFDLVGSGVGLHHLRSSWAVSQTTNQKVISRVRVPYRQCNKLTDYAGKINPADGQDIYGVSHKMPRHYTGRGAGRQRGNWATRPRRQLSYSR